MDIDEFSQFSSSFHENTQNEQGRPEIESGDDDPLRDRDRSMTFDLKEHCSRMLYQGSRSNRAAV